MSPNRQLLIQKGAPEVKVGPSILNNTLMKICVFQVSGVEKEEKIESESDWKLDAEIERFLTSNWARLGPFLRPEGPKGTPKGTQGDSEHRRKTDDRKRGQNGGPRDVCHASAVDILDPEAPGGGPFRSLIFRTCKLIFDTGKFPRI